MKLWRVNPPIYIILWGSILFIGILSTLGQTEEVKAPSQEVLDSISKYYALSKSDSSTINQRLKNITSFLEIAKFYEQDSMIYNGLMQKTWLLSKAKMYDSAIAHSHKLYDFAKFNRDTSYMLKAYIKLGIYHKKNNAFTEAFKYYNEAFKISRKTKDSLCASKNLLQMSYIQSLLGDYSGSKTTAVDGVKFAEKTSSLKNLSGLYHIISVANLEQKNHREALKYNSLALMLGKDSLALKSIQLNNILKYENTRALILADTMNYKDATKILTELANDSIVKANKYEYSRVLGNLGYILWLQNNRNKRSEKLLLNSLEIREDINDKEGLISGNIYLTKYYENDNETKALSYAEAAYRNALDLKSLTSIIEALGYIFKLKENVQEEAKIFNETYHKLNEINQNNREIYAVTKYENENLTNENLKLETDNAKLEIEKAKEERENIIYLLSTIILILSGGFVVYLLQQKHKRERIRDVFNAETRISKKLHDELANDVYHVMTQIQNKRNDHEVLDKLEDIYSRTRDISRENSNFKINKDFVHELSGMLSSYGSLETKIIIKDIDDIHWSSITPEKKIIIHRIIQELMVNMKKHSQATLVAVTFKKGLKTHEISYADNGVGVAKNDIIYSSGLQNAENRIKTIGGSFIFDSEEGKGFKARIHFPN
ncbi:sensor histidine kinase [Aquimarina celericrescens]|uniref:Sensor histidine kinase n=1 Tax=Aquimarina celericrescens TaxID=1964542 RepID=A0ABW5AU52_9FLAO|nr:hypothetical protein [Aquimarina celericrescens]